jgi:hypothetical protein
MKPSVSVTTDDRPNHSQDSQTFQSDAGSGAGGPAAGKASADAANEYTGASIRILSPEEVSRRFDWSRAGHLAEEFKKDRKFIERGLAACRNAGLPDGQYFIDRYLRGDKTVPVNAAADLAFRELFLTR